MPKRNPTVERTMRQCWLEEGGDSFRQNPPKSAFAEVPNKDRGEVHDTACARIETVCCGTSLTVM